MQTITFLHKLHEIKNTDNFISTFMYKAIFIFFNMKPGLIEQFEKESTKQMGIYHNAG